MWRNTLGLAVLMISIALFGLPIDTAAANSSPKLLNQGPQWTQATRAQFYSLDQGSDIMPLSWFTALKQPNGQPFVADSLGRYGYLPNPASPTPGLPVGFTLDGSGSDTMVGMTCAACHTRQIKVQGQEYRIDGGPAIVDLQSLLADLRDAVARVLDHRAAFSAFAIDVLGPAPDRAEKAALRRAVEAWQLRFATLMDISLPEQSWGPGRADCVGLIFNRVTGLDIGPPPSYIIRRNIREAAAPVRYPFIWNASIQDRTQWAGFAENGNALLALARNVGEVYGVFGQFAPQKTPTGIDYLAVNSVDIPNLLELEELIARIGPPRWPWGVNHDLAERGKAIFNRPTARGGCVDCHGIKPGVTRPVNQKTWLTPVLNVGTDTRAYDNFAWTARTGVLNGASTAELPTPLKPVDLSINVLSTAVTGAIGQFCEENPSTCGLTAEAGRSAVPATAPRLEQAGSSGTTAGLEFGAYESRVLEGVWAAAPYLHNGSVPTLAQLLTPPAQRVRSFRVGPNYDTKDIGLATHQTKFDYVLHATGCDDLNSGNSNCGHDFGTRLSPPNKRALLEYLKTL